MIGKKLNFHSVLSYHDRQKGEDNRDQSQEIRAYQTSPIPKKSIMILLHGATTHQIHQCRNVLYD